jgi:hypothetical protein
MLRTLVLALALGAPSLAVAQERQQFPESAVGIEVRGDDGTVIGHVDAVERNGSGRIVAVEIAGQEPPSAPYAPRDLIAQSDDENTLFISDRRGDRRPAAGGERTRIR